MEWNAIVVWLRMWCLMANGRAQMKCHCVVDLNLDGCSIGAPFDVGFGPAIPPLCSPFELSLF